MGVRITEQQWQLMIRKWKTRIRTRASLTQEFSSVGKGGGRRVTSNLCACKRKLLKAVAEGKVVGEGS